MNNKFDGLTKGMAQSVTRRLALKKCGVGLAGRAPACFGLVVLTVIGLASNASAQPANAGIAGRAVEDLTGNGVSTDDPIVAGRNLQLFRDTGDGVFNAANDILVKSDTSKRDGTYS